MVVSEARFLENLMSSGDTFEMRVYGKTIAPDNWRVGPREIDEHMIHFLVKGKVSAVIGEETFELIGPCVYWVQPGVFHDLILKENSGAASFYYYRFRFGSNACCRLKDNVSIYRKNMSILELMDRILPQYHFKPEFSNSFKRAQIAHLVGELLNLEETKQFDGLKIHHQRLAMQFIQNHLGEKFNISDLSDHLELNEDYFSRQFKKTFGVSPVTFIKEERMNEASRLLLETNLNVSQVGRVLSYPDVYQFSKQFKQTKGLSPNQYRLAHV